LPPEPELLAKPHGGLSDRVVRVSFQYVYVYVDVYVDVMAVKTTILLREDVKDHLLRRVGPRGLSAAINEILAKNLFRSKESRFGADPWLNTKGLRDEREPHEDL
jgi:hypothetical protein